MTLKKLMMTNIGAPMYSLLGKFSNAFDVLVYTVNAMKESGYSHNIYDYLLNAIQDNNYNLINVSSYYISECNKIISVNNKYKYINDDVLTCDEDQFGLDQDEDFYEGFSDSGGYHYYLSDDDTDDDCCYEGFFDCSNHFWDSLDNDEEDNSYN